MSAVQFIANNLPSRTLKILFITCVASSFASTATYKYETRKLWK